MTITYEELMKHYKEPVLSEEHLEWCDNIINEINKKMIEAVQNGEKETFNIEVSRLVLNTSESSAFKYTKQLINDHIKKEYEKNRWGCTINGSYVSLVYSPPKKELLTESNN